MDLGKNPDDFEIPVQCPISKDTNIKYIIFSTDLPEDCFFTQQVGSYPRAVDQFVTMMAAC